MSDNEAKAQALVQEAEKKLNKSKGFLGNLFGYELWKKNCNVNDACQFKKKKIDTVMVWTVRRNL